MNMTSGNEDERAIPRPDITVAQIVLTILAQKGRASFQQLRSHPATKSLGAERSENSFYTALARLKRKKTIRRTEDDCYELTEAGEFTALKAHVRMELTTLEKRQSATKSLSSEIKWDGRWRIVLFDVPESKRAMRDYLRRVLQRQGFIEFQRSMWVWPHKVPSHITKLLADPLMRKYTRMLTTYDIDYDEDLRRKFKLS